MKLIDNIGQAPKMLSVQLAAFGAVASGVWLSLGEAQQQAILGAIGIPPSAMALIGFVAVVVGRLVKQESISGGAETQRGGGQGEESGTES